MEFGVRGTPTPRAQQRQIPGSARRPQSSRQGRNPITGEEYAPVERVAEPVTQARNVNNSASTEPHSRPNSVPSLNLNYLQDNEEKTGAINISLRDYKLDSPGTASTISWGTARSGLTSRNDIQSRATSTKPSGIPGLPLGVQNRPPSARKIPKQPTAWDRDPVPEDVPAPSASHRQLYQQYADDMKQGFRAQAHPSKVSEEEVQRTMQAMKAKGQQGQSAQDDKGEDSGDDQEDVGNDVVEERWKKQRYTSNHLRKKLDAEGLLEQNKKLKLLETVMIDQLSRAVISDPEQDLRGRPQSGRSSQRALRGTNRYLHDSRVSTRSTATENLLSRRVRFGARIIARNGRDAVRELTGFFFQVDRSMTVYEFKQFGKSAKAIPFVHRGVFCHPIGPKTGHPYSLSDIRCGTDLHIPTEGQHTLSSELARRKYLTLRITDVDEAEKAELFSEEMDENTARQDEANQTVFENQQFLLAVQESAQAQIRKRGIKTVTNLCRHYRQLDKSGAGDLCQHDLERGLLRFHIDLPPEVLEQVFEIIDPDAERHVDYSLFVRSVLGENNEFRKGLVIKAFCKVDTRRQGSIHLSDIKKFFNASCQYRPGSDAESTKSALQAFLDAVRSSDRQEEVSFSEFEEYYEGLGFGIEEDDDFANILRNTWSI